nr:hypothetical protein Iba_chr02aCG9450 [Ipomoea batatas]
MQHIYEGGNRVADAFENVGVKVPSRLLLWSVILPSILIPCKLTNALSIPFPTDSDCDELISRKTLRSSARGEDEDDSSDDEDEELEGVVEIFSLDFEVSTAHMETHHAALRASHKGKATAAEKGKGKAADVVPSDLTLAARLPSAGVIIGASPTAVALAVAP